MLVPLLLGTLAFRCPGPDPEQGPGPDEDGGGGTGAGGPGPTSQSSTGPGPGGCDPMMVGSDPMNCGACGRPCSMMNVDQVACVAGLCESSCIDDFDNDMLPPAPAPDDGCETFEPPPVKRVFVTDSPQDADFGSALAADAVCQSIADDLGLLGTWMAWVSDASTSPQMRFNHSTDPYVRLDGVQVADDWDDLANGDIDAPINYTELGQTLPFNEVWTGTSTLGYAIDVNPCAEWTQNLNKYTATVGRTDAVDTTWTAVFTQECSRINVHLYCFEQ